jgi:SAM-dependent methyltransferase
MISLKNLFGKKQQVMTIEEETALREQYASNIEGSEEFNQAAEATVPEVRAEEFADSLESDASYLLTDPRVVGWLSTAEQELLFSALLLFYRPETHSMLDVGCGRADLYGYLKDLYQLDDVIYTGMDMNPNIISVATQKFPTVNVIAGDILNDSSEDRYDWVVGSGLFNLIDHPDMMVYTKEVIDKMVSKANIGISFNLLTGLPEDLSDTDKEQLFVHDPSIWLDYLINTYNKVICRHDYLSGDVTFYIFK